MIKKTENGHNIGRITVIIAVFSLLAKVLGVVRDAVFSNRFGTSVVMDSYFAAFRVPDFVFNLLILGTFSVAFIPVFSEWLIKDKKEANRVASGILNVTLLLMVGLSILALIFINPLVRAIAPGFSGESFELTKLFTKIFLLSPIFLSMSSITSSVLNTMKRFTLVAAAPVLYNLSIIGGVLFLYPRMGNVGLAVGVVIGAILHFLIQIPQMVRLGFKYYPVIEFHHPGFIKFWKLYWPRIFSMGTGQVTLLVVSIFGSYLGTGALSAFYYANNLQSVFLSIFAISAALAVFPLLSDLYNQKDEERFKDVVAKTTIQILYFIIPLSVLMLIMRAQVVRLVLGFGQGTNFTFADTRIVALTLGLFSVSLFAQALIPLYTRAFYARQNTKIPVIIGLVTIVVNIVLTYFLSRTMGIPGMTLSFSITSIFTMIILLMELHHKIGNLHDEYLTISSLKIVISSVLAGIVTFLLLYLIAPLVDMNTYFGVMIQAFGAGLGGVLVYLGASWVMGLNETHDLIRLTRSMLSKFARPFNAIWNIWS